MMKMILAVEFGLYISNSADDDDDNDDDDDEEEEEDGSWVRSVYW
jgi:hypothetical protein